ncbi:hypothetical protein [Natrononativus amylolyticus]|uniref:hypothetical protein n=1 Tax=Natrononativus amylolyticus TaxID=2963434 RepID=UPI0020CFAA3B|nr:hypothetical protein [Natrononativus amylolyticus]
MPVTDLEGRVLHDTEANELLRVIETTPTEVTVRPIEGDDSDETTVRVHGGRGLRSGEYIVKSPDAEFE